MPIAGSTATPRETPAVLGVSPWLTPYQLWLQRTGRAEPKVNPADAAREPSLSRSPGKPTSGSPGW